MSLMIFHFWTVTILSFLLKMAFVALGKSNRNQQLEMIPKCGGAEAQSWP